MAGVGKELYEDIYKDGFSFGENWKKFLSKFNRKRLKLAKKSLGDFTGLKSLKGMVFVDIGCGSGLFSLAAAELGAKKVVSVDIDDSSIACTSFLRKKFGYSKARWNIRKGSALDRKFLASLPRADLLYSWGVLHHTGRMYEALGNVSPLVQKGGLFYVAIYNDFRGLPFSSKAWVRIKRFYSRRGRVVRWIMRRLYAGVIIAGLIAYRRNPISYIRNYGRHSVRGMDFFVDVEDWMGGYPYEYATTGQIKAFFAKRGLELENIRTTTREGCNEFLFRKR